MTADAWCVFDVDSQRHLFGRLASHRREVASLTKMMTFLVAYQTFQKYFPELTSVEIVVPEYCTQVIGTSAQLQEGDSLTL